MVGFQFDAKIDFSKVGISKSEIEDLLLPHWNTKVNEVYHYKNRNLNEITILINAKTETDVQQWLQDYEEKSKCSYSIRSTEKCSGSKVVFKRRLKCQHNTRNKNIYDPTDKTKTRNSNCPSTITITLRAVLGKYQGRDKTKAPDPNMPCEIKIIPHHNHSTSTADALRFRQVNNETKKKLTNLYESGYSPANALESIKMEIQMKHDNFHELLVDRSVCPDYMYCYHLYMNTFKQKYKPFKASPEFLESKVNKFNQDANVISALIKFIDKDYVICLCPPLMQRVHETVEEAAKIVYIDSTGTVDHDGNRIFVLLTPSKGGGLPLAIFITTSEYSHLISLGFQLLKEIMGDRIFYGNIDGPTVFMTEDSAAEHAAIQFEWPKSTTLLCTFHVLQSVWRWLMSAKNGIQQDHQIQFYQEFRNIVYANNEEDCISAFQIALTGSDNYPEYQSYLYSYWEQRTLWALCYQDHSRQEYYTDSVSVAAMRFLKEKIFDGIKAFNLVQAVDFMMNKFISYYELRLLDAHNEIRQNILYRLINLPPSADIIEQVQELTENIYLLPSENDLNSIYTVNIEVLSCTCNQRRKNMCKHIDWICGFVIPDKFIKRIDERTIKKYNFIATGNEDNESEKTSIKCFPENIEMISESSMDMVEEVSKERFISNGKETINKINEIFSQYLNNSPLEVSEALEVFCDGLKEIESVSGFVTACHAFSSGIINPRINRDCRRTYLIGKRSACLHSGKDGKKSTTKIKKLLSPKKELI